MNRFFLDRLLRLGYSKQIEQAACEFEPQSIVVELRVLDGKYCDISSSLESLSFIENFVVS